MKNLNLARNVILVSGCSKDAIYDLENGDLYQISKQASSLIKEFLASNQLQSNNSVAERTAIQFLLDKGLLERSHDKSSSPTIEFIEEGSKVSFAWIEVTKGCNLTCVHCYENSSPHLLGDSLSLDDAKYVLDRLVQLGVSSIQFIGGEPLVHKQLKDMIVYARDRFPHIEVYTNGLLITDDWIDFFSKNKISVAVSLHSYDSREHDKVTNKVGSYNRVTRTIEKLKLKNIRHRVSGVRVSGVDFGVKGDKDVDIREDVVRLVGRAQPEMVSYELFSKKAITKNRFMRKLSKQFVSKNIGTHNCFGSKIYIDTNLQVYPCVMERRVSHGNLKDADNDSVIREDIRSMNKDHIEGCKDCELRYACFDCRPDANGNGLYEKPWYCTYDHSVGKWIDPKDAYNLLFKNTNGKSSELISLVEV